MNGQSGGRHGTEIEALTEDQAAALLGLSPSRFPAWTQGLTITDSSLVDNPIIYASPGFCTLTGYSAAEIIGRNCRFLQGPESNPRTLADLRRAVQARARFDHDVLNYRRDGTPFWNHLSIGPVITAESETLLVGLQFDVSFRYPAMDHPS